MWASPTAGTPLECSYLPPGVQIVLALRPAALAAVGESEKAIAALGPLGDEAIRVVEARCGYKFAAIERLVVGWQLVGDSGELAATIIMYSRDSDQDEPLERTMADAIKAEHDGHAYWRAGDLAYYRPAKPGGPALIVAPAAAIADIIDLNGQPPPLRRDVARLLAETDTDRQVTVVVTPGVLFGEGRELFAGSLAQLRRALFWFLGDELSSAALSLNWGDDFFAEVIATSSLDVPPGRAAERLAERVAQMSEQIEAFVVTLDASPYSRRVVARWPGMVRKLATYTRTGYGRDFVLLRSYLPSIAGHNLLMGAELALAESPGNGSGAEHGGTFAEGDAPAGGASIADKLKQRMSLLVPRDALELVLRQFAQQLGVEIVIRGPDLQLDGITKNQSLSIDRADQPAEDILVEILRLANPDKSAADPADPKQKLVYVIGPKSPGGPDVIFVTTRSRAAARGETLPTAFVAK